MDVAIKVDRPQQRSERLAGARWQIEDHDGGVRPIDEREQPADEQPDASPRLVLSRERDDPDRISSKLIAPLTK